MYETKPYFYGTGRRKDSVARVRVYTGTGKKAEQKFHITHSKYIGGLKKVQYSKLMAEHSDLAMTYAVKGMIPSNTIGAKALTRLHCYQGAEHAHAAQKPEKIEF